MSNKLYTEEEIRRTFGNYMNKIDFNGVFNAMRPIKLPTDEEIEANAKYNPTNGLKWNPIMKITWVEGAKWMRDKIQGGNNEQ